MVDLIMPPLGGGLLMTIQDRQMSNIFTTILSKQENQLHINVVEALAELDEYRRNVVIPRILDHERHYRTHENALASGVQLECHCNYECDGCSVVPIIGTRYHCQSCENCDLCERCFSQLSRGESSFVHNRTHKFVKASVPDYAPRQIYDKNSGLRHSVQKMVMAYNDESIKYLYDAISKITI
jgi:hypothetical protein